MMQRAHGRGLGGPVESTETWLLVVSLFVTLVGCSGNSNTPSPSPIAPTPQAPVAVPELPAAPSGPMTSVAITFVTPNPSPAGTVFQVSAIATGGMQPHQFKYVSRGDDGTAFTSRGWSTDPSF